MGAQLKAQVDKLLTNVSIMYKPEGYIAEDVLPTLTVKQKSGLIGSYGMNHIRIEDDKVGGEAQARRVQPISRDDSQYLVSSHALEGVVTEDDYDNVEEPFQAESDETEGLTTLIVTNKERALASTLLNPSVITQTDQLSGTAQWSDYSNSDPIGDFKDMRLAVKAGCGFLPNKAIISEEVFVVLQYHPQILSQLGYSLNRAGTLNLDEIAKAMGVKKLFVAAAMYNSAKDGQTAVLASLWGKDCVMYYAPDTAAKKQTSLGYYVRMSSRKARQVYKYPLNNPAESNAIYVRDDYSFELTNVDAAFLMEDVIA